MTTDVDPSVNGRAKDADQRLRDALGNPFSAASVLTLAAGAISVQDALRFGVRAVAHPDHVPTEIDRYWVVGRDRGPGMLFEWRDLDRTVVQFRPDTPVVDEKGKEHKYILPGGCGSFLSHLRAAQDGSPVLLVEGTKQGLSAAVWAPEGWGVVAVPGCDGWSGTDLTWAEGQQVVVLFDGDVGTNRNVHDAAVKLKDALEAEGADSVAFAKLAGARAKEGLDDVLGRRPADKRTDYVRRICEAAPAKLGRPPSRRTDNPYFTEKGLLARTASLAVLEGQPAALASGSMIALYRDGAYRLDRGREPLIERVKTMLGEDFRPNWRSTIEEYLVGELHGRGLRLPDRQGEPLLNCANGMLDLRTGQLADHDPKYLSALQVPVPWVPDAACPVYEKWLQGVIPAQWESLEEVASTMLDPSRTPGRALFGFGPSRSGKGTFLRIMEAVAGTRNVSGVSLHQLADNKFMSAAVYQKMANISGDLSSAHVNDISLFKMLTGEDLIEADRKYGLPFRFTNQALFAFSANDLPTISETSRAYVNRIKPFRFGSTFAGREDPSIEEAMMAELPGILVRWVSRWQAFSERGTYLPTDPAVAHEFETKSDRVSRWLATRCDVHTEAVGQLVGPEHGDTVSALYLMFKQWVKDDGSADAMSRPKFSERLRSVPGVGDVRLKHRNKNAGLNVTTHTGEDREAYQIRTEDTERDRSGVGSVGTQLSHLYVGSESEMIKEVSHPAHRQDCPQPTLPTPTDTSEGGRNGAAGADHEECRGVPLHPRLQRDGEVQERPLDALGFRPGGGGAGSPAVQAVPLDEGDNPFGVTESDDFPWEEPWPQ